MTIEMFSLGVQRKPTKEEIQKEGKLRRRKRIEKSKKRTPSIRILRRGVDSALEKEKPRTWQWRLLPSSSCGSFSFLFDFNDSSLRALICGMQAYPVKKFGEKKQKTSVVLPNTEAVTIFQKNQKLRFCLKSFLNRIRLRKFTYANDLDPVTFEEPKNVVQVIDWTQKRTYRFEAATLLGDIRTRLQHHDYTFPEPLFPRNLVTNLDFTLFQVMTVYQQLLRFGYMHWTLECLRYAEYNITKFALLNYKQLCIKALHQCVYDENDKDMLLDFIELQHVYHGYAFDRNLYIWAVHSKACQHMRRIESWKKYCYEYHETTILFEDAEEQIRRMNRIVYFTSELCKCSVELREMKAMCIV
jgi:hypothetical protein